MAFQTPQRARLENDISAITRKYIDAVNQIDELFEQIKASIADSNNPVTPVGAKAYAENVLGVETGADGELGKSEEWSQALVAWSIAVTAIQDGHPAILANLRKAFP